MNTASATKSRFNSAPKASTTQARGFKATQRVAPKVEVHAASFEEASLFRTPSGTQLLISTVVSFVAYASSMYWSTSVLAWLTVAAITFTGSQFLGFVVLVVGWCLAFFASMRFSYKVFKLCVGYQPGDLAGVGQAITHSAANKVSLVRSWFTRSDSATA